MEKQRTPATLVLEDGTVFHGRSFGAPRPRAGEVVFNTGMVGYPETLSDPSYSGQIITLTFPLVGNYGVPGSTSDHGVEDMLESARIHAHGLVVSDYSEDYSHWAAKRSLGAWLESEGIPAITGIDTRSLTRRLREKGTMLGRIDIEGFDAVPFHNPDEDNLVIAASATAPELIGEGTKRVALLDCGCKHNIIRNILRNGVEVLRVPWDHDLANEKFDALVASNGPGDPSKCDATSKQIRAVIDRGTPVFGICLGHQLIARAIGATTFKMRYGHRSQNQPVRDVSNNRCYITSQNHGFAVASETIPAGWEQWFVNVNDDSNEGLRRADGRVRSIQFHPEASPGPVDTRFLLDEFLTEALGLESAHR